MKLQILDFDWDTGNKEKCKKHGVSIKAIEALFKQPRVLVAPDIKHSEQEERYLAIGKVESDRPIFVAFTLREKHGVSMIRPISARYMHDKEIKRYEENVAQDEK